MDPEKIQNDPELEAKALDVMYACNIIKGCEIKAKEINEASKVLYNDLFNSQRPATVNLDHGENSAFQKPQKRGIEATYENAAEIKKKMVDLTGQEPPAYFHSHGFLSAMCSDPSYPLSVQKMAELAELGANSQVAQAPPATSSNDGGVEK